MIRSAWESNAALVVAPLQDVLGLGSEARMAFALDPHSGVPVYRQLMDQVRYQIAGGLPERDVEKIKEWNDQRSACY